MNIYKIVIFDLRLLKLFKSNKHDQIYYFNSKTGKEVKL